MTVLINDYAGHNFTIQLARELSLRLGYKVFYTYFGSDISPKGNLNTRQNDLEIKSIVLNGKFNKYSFVKRRKQELEFGRQLAKYVNLVKPDVVISANTPLEVNRLIQKKCAADNTKFILWLQDIISIAAKTILKKKLGVLSFPVTEYYSYLEKLILRKSDRIITISEDFVEILEGWGVRSEGVSVIPNWSDVKAVYPFDKKNRWSEHYGLDKTFCVMYSGTLGLKHNPNLFIELSRDLKSHKDIKLVIITEGVGARILDDFIKRENVYNLIRLDYQPINELSLVLGTSDVLIAILEESASKYSVPSKILTYMCAGRPILAVIPNQNLSFKLVTENNCGIGVKLNSSKSILDEIFNLKKSKSIRENMGQNGRKFAQDTFDIHKIADRFERMIEDLF
mgnify:CR=1 FL=1